MNGWESITGEPAELSSRADSLSAVYHRIRAENVPGDNDDPFIEPEQPPNENAAWAQEDLDVHIDEMDKGILNRPHAEGESITGISLVDRMLGCNPSDQTLDNLLDAALKARESEISARELAISARELKLKTNAKNAEDVMKALKALAAALHSDKEKIAIFLKKYGEIEEGMADILRKVDDDVKRTGDVLLCEYEEDL